jgi:hypothetical protein
MRIKQIAIFLSLSLLFIFWHISCSHKPEGVDHTPLYDLQLPNNLDAFAIIFDNDSALAKKYNCQQEETVDGCKWRLMSISINDTNKYVGRDITIMQFKNSSSDALEWYLWNKSSSLVEGKLYKEDKSNNNRYFMTYDGIGIDYNHGIPFIGNYILLELGFLMSNYCIFISYTDFSATSKNVYKYNINNDIVLVSELFNDVLLEYNRKK